MGTQQILLIVLSVIIVGAAIAVGITMFNDQSYASNKTAIAADAQNFATQVVQYYKTPLSQGGADRLPDNMTDTKIGDFIGWQGTTTTNENGIFTVAGWDETNETVTITGLGKEVKGGKKPKIVTTITFPEGEITAVASDVASTATT
jgi:type II secretory pathway pseudopilin PulG